MPRITMRDCLLVLLAVGVGFAACTTANRANLESATDKICAARAQIKELEEIADAGIVSHPTCTLTKPCYIYTDAGLEVTPK